jgi:hypothetical protein
MSVKCKNGIQNRSFTPIDSFVNQMRYSDRINSLHSNRIRKFAEYIIKQTMDEFVDASHVLRMRTTCERGDIKNEPIIGFIGAKFCHASSWGTYLNKHVSVDKCIIWIGPIGIMVFYEVTDSAWPVE